MSSRPYKVHYETEPGKPICGIMIVQAASEDKLKVTCSKCRNVLTKQSAPVSHKRIPF